MSIGLLIANIAGGARTLPAANAVAGENGPSETAPVAAAPSPSALIEPLSGQAQLTPGFTVLVLELLNDKGAVTATIPSAQQLAAYRNGTATPPS